MLFRSDLFGYGNGLQNGKLSPLPGFPVAVCANADSVSIDPTGQFLYVRNGSAGSVTARCPGLPRQCGSPGVAFGLLLQPRHPGRPAALATGHVLRGSIPGLRVPRQRFAHTRTDVHA